MTWADDGLREYAQGMEAPESQQRGARQWNPMKHGYVAQVSHWPYSSFHRYVKQGWLPANWGINIESLNRADFGE